VNRCVTRGRKALHLSFGIICIGLKGSHCAPDLYESTPFAVVCILVDNSIGTPLELLQGRSQGVVILPQVTMNFS
jgi:hypothetical protein